MSRTGPGKVLALDLSTTTGWAFGRPGDAHPTWGAIELPKEEDIGPVIATFEDFLDKMIADLAPDVVAYEAPFPPQRQRDQRSCAYAYGLAGVTEACVFRARANSPLIECRSHAVDTVRAAVIGRKALTEMEKAMRPRVTVKTMIVEPWVRSMGWRITEHNARDAAVVWAYVVGIRHAEFGRRRAA